MFEIQIVLTIHLSLRTESTVEGMNVSLMMSHLRIKKENDKHKPGQNQKNC